LIQPLELHIHIHPFPFLPSSFGASPPTGFKFGQAIWEDFGFPPTKAPPLEALLCQVRARRACLRVISSCLLPPQVFLFLSHTI
jgi:hypothetical protein